MGTDFIPLVTENCGSRGNRGGKQGTKQGTELISQS
jgi:hypothetical protein